MVVNTVIQATRKANRLTLIGDQKQCDHDQRPGYQGHL